MSKLRTYSTGAYRDTDQNKVNFEGHLSPIALEAYGEFLHGKRRIPNRKELRSADNWQLGMSIDGYMEALIRHVLQLWKLHRGYRVLEKGKPITKREALGGILFNAFGHLHELVRAELTPARRKRR